MEEIAKKDQLKNGSYPINKINITDQKGLTHKLISDADHPFIKAKSDITTSIDDYTNIETVICETHNSLIVTSELPKLYKDDLDIDITSQRIILKGESSQEAEIKQGPQKENHQKELNKNIFLPKKVVPGKAEAEFNNDILIIKLPKAEIEKVQKFYSKS
jgi:HSP20 family protein